MTLLSECCEWPPTDDSESVCSRCHEHATFEEETDGDAEPRRLSIAAHIEGIEMVAARMREEGTS